MISKISLLFLRPSVSEDEDSEEDEDTEKDYPQYFDTREQMETPITDLSAVHSDLSSKR